MTLPQEVAELGQAHGWPGAWLGTRSPLAQPPKTMLFGPGSVLFVVPAAWGGHMHPDAATQGALVLRTSAFDHFFFFFWIFWVIF